VAVHRRRSLAALIVVLGLAGFVLLQLPGNGTLQSIGAVLLLGALFAVIGLVVGWLGPQSRPDREREALAREEFDRTGSWPSES
jgi:hypothetical protein